VTVIRPAKILDLKKLDQLSKQAASRDYGFYSRPVQQAIAARNSWQALLIGHLTRRRNILVAQHQGCPVGFLVGTPNNDGVAIVHWLYIDPEFRGGGMARELLDDFERRLAGVPVHKIMLWTEIAAGYYRRIGWEEVAVLPNHWWGKDFSLFVKTIKTANRKTNG
jgi:GNAT superfamily N-acetyltransferase